ncbi:hypothetical protein [Nocardiopsis sp. FIRDI 009]|uniref:hypothetical protein n=1 Tax=Nocardiopsis sp. FIRDI 009 TaxID=714197 RepID=UPI0013004809|nr:hypothetical protein [Nocardiopsis sp. FIRDI 009]
MTRPVPEPAAPARPVRAPAPTVPAPLTAQDLVPRLRELARALRERGQDPAPRDRGGHV